MEYFMKTIQVKIKGLSPILINKFKDHTTQQEAVKKSTKKDYGTPEEQAIESAYFDTKSKKVWVPTTWLTGCLKTVSSEYKLAGTRKSIKSGS